MATIQKLSYTANEIDDRLGLAGNAVTYTPQALDEKKKAQARDNIGATTMEDTVEKLCPTFAASGYAVSCEPVEGYPLEVVSKIDPIQSGSGDPLPNNIRPISGHDLVQLTQSGKNLLAYPYVDTTKTVDGMTFTDNGDGSITLNGTSTSPYLSYRLHLETFADALKDGVTYRLSTGTDDTNIAIVCYYKNESGASVWASGNMTWKKEYTLAQVYLQVTEVATYTNMVLYPQIEIGTTTTAYEPYKGNTFTMDLGQEVYGGSLNWNTGVLTVDMMAGLNQGEFYQNYPENTDFVSACWGNTEREPLSPVLCDKLPVISWDNHSAWTQLAPYVWYANTSFGVAVPKSIIGVTDDDGEESVVQKVLNYVNNLDLTIVCKLIDPITIQLTPQEIVALSGTNILSSDTGITEVTGRANPVAIINNLQDRIAALEAAIVNNA